MPYKVPWYLGTELSYHAAQVGQCPRISVFREGKLRYLYRQLHLASFSTGKMERSEDARSKQVSFHLQPNGALSVRHARTELRSKAEDERLRRARKYERGRPVDTKNVRDKKLRRNLKSLEGKFHIAKIRASEAEILDETTEGFLEPEGELERTWRTRQDEIVDSVAIQTGKNRFDLK